MKAVWVFIVMTISSCIESQETGGYFGTYSSGNYYIPQVELMRPAGAHHARLLPFGEELFMNSVVEQSAYFKIKSKAIKQWLRLQSDHQYLLGIGDREVTLISMYKIKDNSYQAHEYPIAMPYEINCATMFETQTVPHGRHTQHGFVLIGFDSPEPTVVLYKIKNFKLVNVTTWKREHRVQSVAHFKWHQEDRIVVVEDANNISIVKVHGLKFEQHLPHYWHVETLPMDKIEGHPSFGCFRNGRVYMAVIQKRDSTVKVYTYKNVCHANHLSLSGSKFELVQFLSPMVAKKIVFFEAYDRKYLMAISLNTMLYTISLEDHLMQDTRFTLSEDMIVLPLPPPSKGAILLGKSLDGTPHVYTLSNPEGQWRESPTPRCRRSGLYPTNDTTLEVDLKECIGGSRSWTGATYIEAEGYPSLLFADRTYPGELYHFSYSIRSPPVGPQNTIYNTLDEIESVWNTVRSNLLDHILGRSTVDPTDSTPICSVQPEIKRMHRILSELKDRLALAHCSAFPTDLAEQEAEHNIVVDEGKPQEVISQPSEGELEIFEKVEKSGENTNNEHQSLFVEPISRKEDYNSRKITILSPELEGKNWKEEFINDPGMGELVDIYGN